MKLLMLYTSHFAYQTNRKSLQDADFQVDKKEFSECVTAFIHAEVKDQERPKAIENNLVKNLKWAARKNETKCILLHSFSHLSDSKADPDFTKELLDKVEARLMNAGFDVAQTPWGYFLVLDLQAPGFSLARVFKSF